MRPDTLTFAAGSTARLQPLLDGEVQPEGVTLLPSVVALGDLLWVMPDSEPYDIAEMSITGYLWSRQRGRRWVALPVFPAWVDGCHAETLVNVHSGIDGAEDLRGKRVGVPEYAVTAIAWIRDAWEAEHGIAPEEIVWCEERTPQSSHYRPWGYRPPDRMTVELIPSERCLSDMLIRGEIDAVTRYFGGLPTPKRAPFGDRSPLRLDQMAAHPDLRWLYPDRIGVVRDYRWRLGSPQPIHCIVAKQDVLDQHPGLARSLYEAFVEAARRTQDMISVHAFTTSGSHLPLDDDFSPCGLGTTNRAMVQRLLALAGRDGLILGDPPAIDDLFHPETLDL